MRGDRVWVRGEQEGSGVGGRAVHEAMGPWGPLGARPASGRGLLRV